MAIVKMLKTGETDIDSTDIWRFAFHSGYPTLKIATSGSSSLSLTPGNFYAEYTAPHDLGYKPMYFANIQYGTRAYSVQANVTPISESGYVEVMNELGYTSIVNFYSTVTYNDLIIGVSTGDGENADETISFTVYWTVYLDEF